ncbi:MAG: NAD(P)H-hydrate dehydratase [Chloroflexi bacterium]|nr:NAD(P)H-hydrate dehydratase [Chloroflexota bacterium]
MKLVTSTQMRALEQRADAAGNSFAAMMERAGTLTAQAIQQRFTVQNKRVLVLVGPGNNGGDGLVCARVLHDAGANVSLYVWRRVPALNDVNWDLCLERNIPLTRVEDDADFSKLKAELAQTDLIIDALLGAGVARPIEGTLKELLLTTREARKGTKGNEGNLLVLSPSLPLSPSLSLPLSLSPSLTIAIDLPTGLNPDTGALDPAALAADMTVTFAFPKVGQFAFPGADAVGELIVADIGIPSAWANDIALDVASADEIRARLPKRPRSANKGTFGKAMLACGSLNFTGAPVLAARAAGRVGAGLVTLAVPESVYPIVAAKIDEATFLPLPDKLGEWRPRGANELLAVLWDAAYDVLLVGCGLGQSESTGDFLVRLLEHFNTLERAPALVLDADALNLLSGLDEWWTRLAFPAPPILTPHPGEMARLLGKTTAEVQHDRVNIARDAARQWNAIVLLKGAFTVIAAPDGRVTLLPFANPALASAGTGDVLAGTIAGILAQYVAAGKREASNVMGEASNVTRETSNVKREAARPESSEGSNMMRDMFNATVVGAYIHALAGEIAARDIGDAGVVAGDLLPRLPKAIKRLK